MTDTIEDRNGWDNLRASRRGILAACLVLCAAGLGAEEPTANPEKYAFGFGLDLNVEYRLAPADAFLIERGTVKTGIDLERAFFGRSPFARIEMGYGRAEGLSLALECEFRPTWSGDWGKADNLPGAGKGEPLGIENFFLTRGVLAYRMGGSFISLGRDQPDYDGTLRGSLLPGRRLPFLDALRARGKMGSFTLDWMAATIQALPSWDGVDVDPNAGVGAAAPVYDWEYGVEPTIIVEVLNRFSWVFGDFVLGVSDHAMLARRNNRFYWTDFLPVSSRHQTAVAGTNNSMVLDLTWRPLPTLSLRAEAGFDDISASSFGVEDTGSPTIDAYVLGASYGENLAAGAIDARLELGYTQYLWGNYEGGEIKPNDQNPFLRFQYRYLVDSGDALLLPLTSPYGPGALWLEAAGGFEPRKSNFRFGIELLLLRKNTEANLITTAVLNNSTTASAPTFLYTRIALPCRMRFGEAEFCVSPTLHLRDSEPYPEATFSARWSLRSGAAKRAP